jgi:hypothetical protein
MELASIKSPTIDTAPSLRKLRHQQCERAASREVHAARCAFVRLDVTGGSKRRNVQLRQVSWRCCRTSRGCPTASACVGVFAHRAGTTTIDRGGTAIPKCEVPYVELQTWRCDGDTITLQDPDEFRESSSIQTPYRQRPRRRSVSARVPLHPRIEKNRPRVRARKLRSVAVCSRDMGNEYNANRLK